MAPNLVLSQRGFSLGPFPSIPQSHEKQTCPALPTPKPQAPLPCITAYPPKPGPVAGATALFLASRIPPLPHPLLFSLRTPESIRPRPSAGKRPFLPPLSTSAGKEAAPCSNPRRPKPLPNPQGAASGHREGPHAAGKARAAGSPHPNPRLRPPPQRRRGDLRGRSAVTYTRLLRAVRHRTTGGLRSLLTQRRGSGGGERPGAHTSAAPRTPRT